MKYRERKILLTVLVGAMLVSLAAVGEFRVENGNIVVDSPFDLEIGSAEYAKALGDGINSCQVPAKTIRPEQWRRTGIILPKRVLLSRISV